MPSTQTTHNTGAHQRRAQYARWARLLDSILPPPDENRLVPVTEVSRDSLPFVADCLADVGLSPVLSETHTMSGASRFRVLVPARDAELAGEGVAGI